MCVVSLAGCDSSPTAPDMPAGETVALAGGSLLIVNDAAALAEHRAQIEQIVRDTVALVRGQIPIDGVTIIAGVGTASVIPELGMGGRADRNAVNLTFEPASPALAGALGTELFGLLAHELHHTARDRTVGYGNNLLSAIVSEGLADQFAVQVTGNPPPMWSTALTPDQLATWSAVARGEWFDTGYNHGMWFFGEGGGIPRWAGYTIGFELTGGFLDAHPGRTAADLHNEPAASFIPPG